MFLGTKGSYLYKKSYRRDKGCYRVNSFFLIIFGGKTPLKCLRLKLG